MWSVWAVRGRGLAWRRAAGTRAPMKSEMSFFHARWPSCNPRRRAACVGAFSAQKSTSTTTPSMGCMQVVAAGWGRPQVAKSPSHLTSSIQATTLGTATSTSLPDHTSTLLFPRRLMGNLFLLQNLTENPTRSPRPFTRSAPASSPIGAGQLLAR